MKKNISALVLLLQLLLILNARSQNTYSFSKTFNNPYADLAGDITIPAFDPVNGLFFITDFQGETFKFFDVDFTFGGIKTVTAGEYPFLRIDNDSSLVVVDAAFTYADTIDATTRVSYLSQGAPGTRLLKLQYKNFTLRDGQPGNFINVQIWYYQAIGVVEIHYGPRSANNVSGYTISNGPNVGIFYSPDDFSTCYQKLWVNGSPAAPTLDSAATLVFKSMSGVPDEGTIYRFSPRPTETVVTTSVHSNMQNETFRIAPNPCTEKISIAGNFQNTVISLYGLEGRLLRQIQVDHDKAVEISVVDLPPGFYTLTIRTKEGSVSRKVIVK